MLLRAFLDLLPAMGADYSAPLCRLELLHKPRADDPRGQRHHADTHHSNYRTQNLSHDGYREHIPIAHGRGSLLVSECF